MPPATIDARFLAWAGRPTRVDSTGVYQDGRLLLDLRGVTADLAGVHTFGAALIVPSDRGLWRILYDGEIVRATHLTYEGNSWGSVIPAPEPPFSWWGVLLSLALSAVIFACGVGVGRMTA